MNLTVTGKFIGADKSMGFRHGEIYSFNVVKDEHSVITSIYTKSGLNCEYSSAYRFLCNWRVIDQIFN